MEIKFKEIVYEPDHDVYHLGRVYLVCRPFQVICRQVENGKSQPSCCMNFRKIDNTAVE